MATVSEEHISDLPQPRTRRGLPPAQAIPLGLLALILGLAIFGPGTLQYKMDVLGFGVCHQMLTHSFIIGGHPLPVCARCTGIYVGAFTGLILLLVLRPRAQGLPSPLMLSILMLMFLTMGADGVNSTFQELPGGQGLWETTNVLRVITGTLAGVAIMFFLYPMFNSAFWRRDLLSDESVIDRPFELFGYGVAAAVLVALTLTSDGDTGATVVYWLVGLVSIGGLLTLLTLANTMIVTLVTKREGQIGSWQAAFTPLLIALALAICELLLLAYLRGELSLVLHALPGNMPVVPGVR
jgi:uncharacterized membrane protein